MSEERESEKRLLQETIEEASKEKEKIDKKWQIDFEKLRTINIMKEQQLLDDFEWKLREVEQKCKKRLEDEERKIDERLQEAYKDAYEKMQKAENMMSEVSTLCFVHCIVIFLEPPDDFTVNTTHKCEHRIESK